MNNLSRLVVVLRAIVLVEKVSRCRQLAAVYTTAICNLPGTHQPTARCLRPENPPPSYNRVSPPNELPSTPPR